MVAVGFLKRVKLAFLVKMTGGTGDDGITWPPLSREYLAYGRGPFSSRRAGGLAPGIVRGGDRDGQPMDGFMSKSQLAQWRHIFAQSLARLRMTTPEPAARVIAAKIAWARMKERGVKTKINIFGNRKVDMLRDRGVLYHSLSPGELGPNNEYSPPPDQVVRDIPGGVVVGTSVQYATFHQNAKPPRKKRQLWPDELPASWAASITAELQLAIGEIIGGVLGKVT